MKYIIPQYSGFCFGVSLAVNAAYAYTDGSAFMYGEVVHNPTVVNDLQNKGLHLIHHLDEIQGVDRAKVLIRAHGVSKATVEAISSHGIEVIDKTCPRVKKIHHIVENASMRGLDAIIVGTPKHPEVKGIIGWVQTKSVLLHTLEDAKRIIPHTNFSSCGVCMVSQTTHNQKKYEEIYAYCSSIIPNIEFHNTICNATANRQNEVRRLAHLVDGFIIVGGKTSSNVTKLYEIALETCSQTQHIETARELDLSKISGVNLLAIVGGASTPESSVRDVIERIWAYCDSQGISLEEEQHLR